MIRLELRTEVHAFRSRSTCVRTCSSKAVLLGIVVVYTIRICRLARIDRLACGRIPCGSRVANLDAVLCSRILSRRPVIHRRSAQVDLEATKTLVPRHARRFQG